MQPGETVTPGPTPTPEQPQPPEIPDQAPLQQVPMAAPAEGWQFSNEDQVTDAGPSPASQVDAVSWTASEFISHAKGPSWFVALIIGLTLIDALVFFVTKDIVTLVAVTTAGTAFAFFAGRQPRVLEYAVDARGLHIGPKLYPFADFKSFDITEEGSLPAIQLRPLKRFMPPLTVFYDPAQEDTILGTISNFLPHQEEQASLVDSFSKRIRF